MLPIAALTYVTTNPWDLLPLHKLHIAPRRDLRHDAFDGWLWVPRWRVDASRAVSPRARLGGAGDPPGTQVGLLGPGCAAVPAPGGRAGQKIAPQ